MTFHEWLHKNRRRVLKQERQRRAAFLMELHREWRVAERIPLQDPFWSHIEWASHWRIRLALQRELNPNPSHPLNAQIRREMRAAVMTARKYHATKLRQGGQDEGSAT